MPQLKTLSYRASQRWTESEARTALEALTASGLPLPAFAEREGLEAQRLYAWRRKLACVAAATPAAATPAFVEIRGVVGRERVDVVLPSGIVLRVSESIEPTALRRLADALEEGRSSAC